MSKAIVSKLYDSDVFRMACRQFDQAADAINRAVGAVCAGKLKSLAAGKMGYSTTEVGDLVAAAL